ncbi:MAG: DUF3899 domain-containing protein [Bacilli bacterium]
MKKLFFHSPIRYIIALVVALVFILIRLISSQGFTEIIAYCDGTFFAGMVLVCVGGLSVVSYYGGFDIFSYNIMKKKEGVSSLYDYSQIKAERRKNAPPYYMPYFAVGIFFLLISAILLIIIQNI